MSGIYGNGGFDAFREAELDSYLEGQEYCTECGDRLVNDICLSCTEKEMDKIDLTIGIDYRGEEVLFIHRKHIGGLKYGDLPKGSDDLELDMESKNLAEAEDYPLHFRVLDLGQTCMHGWINFVNGISTITQINSEI